MLTVWCVCVGDKYSVQDVHILRNMVERHLPVAHRFMCLSDRRIDGVDIFIPAEVWPGWWSKLLLFRYAVGQVLYLDLDVVVVDDLRPLISGHLSIPANWAQSGHGGCQSSVMSWDSRATDLSALADSFDPSLLEAPRDGNCGAYRGLWGDQEYITDKLGDPGEYIHPMAGVYSYKYHCRNGIPSDARVIAFHGLPKPQDLNDTWVIAARSFMPTAA